MCFKGMPTVVVANLFHLFESSSTSEGMATALTTTSFQRFDSDSSSA